jgi:hypothetical protein
VYDLCGAGRATGSISASIAGKTADKKTRARGDVVASDYQRLPSQNVPAKGMATTMWRILIGGCGARNVARKERRFWLKYLKLLISARRGNRLAQYVFKPAIR